MISRFWHGYTTTDNADAYESLLKTEIFEGIKNRQIKGYTGIHLFKRKMETEIEFITLMWFENLEAVKVFAGEDYETSVVPPKARALLSHYDQQSQHYDVLVESFEDI